MAAASPSTPGFIKSFKPGAIGQNGGMTPPVKPLSGIVIPLMSCPHGALQILRRQSSIAWHIFPMSPVGGASSGSAETNGAGAAAAGAAAGAAGAAAPGAMHAGQANTTAASPTCQ